MGPVWERCITRPGALTLERSGEALAVVLLLWRLLAGRHAAGRPLRMDGSLRSAALTVI